MLGLHDDGQRAVRVALAVAGYWALHATVLTVVCGPYF